MAKIKRDPVAVQIADLIVKNYSPKNGKDVQEALKDIFGPIFESMLNAEMDAHLGYTKNEIGEKEHDNRRNGYTTKTIEGSFGEKKYKFQEIEKAVLNQYLFQKGKKMYQKWKEKYLQCMQEV